MTHRTTVVLHASPLRLGLQASGPVLLLLIAATAVRASQAVPVGAVVVGGLGLVLAGVLLFDVPHRVEFDPDGVTRTCVLRRQHIPWSTVTAVARTRIGGGLRRGGSTSDEPDTGGRSLPQLPQRRGGLVLRIGARKHVTLVERAESHAEWAAIRDLLAERATAFTASEPPLDATPAGRGPRALHRSR